jgi:hypothetical protein
MCQDISSYLLYLLQHDLTSCLSIYLESQAKVRSFAQRPLRGIDRRLRLVAVRGELEADVLGQIDRALKVVFGLA